VLSVQALVTKVGTRFFDVLGVEPVAGRTFRPDDAAASAAQVVVVSEGLWRTRFGADPALVGRDIRLNGQPFTVIGIVADNVQLQRPARIWTLLPDVPALASRDARFLHVIGRLRPGVTLSAAQADLGVIADALARAYPDTNKDWSVSVQPLRAGVMGAELQSTSIFLLGVVGFVLLLCCANVANLLLARGSSRARELAVRSALGAGKARIVSQLLTESLVLAALGGLLGLGLGTAFLNGVLPLIPSELLPAAATIELDGRVVMFCVVAAMTVGLLFGLAPAWQAAGLSLVQAVASESRSTTRRGGRFRNVLVAGEVAAAVLLLCGAGLLLRSLLALGTYDPGYRADSDSVLTLDFSLEPPGPGSRYPTLQSLMQFYDEATRQIGALPRVARVGWTTALPYGDTELGPQRFAIVGDPPVTPAERPMADFQAASAGYFTTLDIPVVAGRAFTDRDTRDSAPVCIVSEAFVRRYLAGRNPIGVRMDIDPVLPGLTGQTVREIVGVVRQVKGRVGEPEDRPQAYVPLAQFPWTDTFLVVQASAGAVQTLLTPVREVVARIDANVPVRRERTLTDLAALTMAPHRLRAGIVATFAGLALLLAMVGIFGVLTYSVEQRTREFGVRIALGATAASVLGLVAGSAARVVAVGGAVGIIAAAALARTISVFLFGVEPLDPVTYVAVAVVLIITAGVAAAAPAWRAASVDPVEAFRSE
jgi:putative ABC transport system permease protein